MLTISCVKLSWNTVICSLPLVKVSLPNIIVQLLNLYDPYVEDDAETTEEVAEPEVAGPPVKPSVGHGDTVKTTGTEKPTITESEIAKFYDDAQRGKYKDNRDEFDRRDAEIDAALEEGRIVSG